MKLRLALISCLLAAPLAHADDFAARAAAGQKAIAAPRGNAFVQTITPLLEDADNACDPPGTILPAGELGALEIVGDITPAGALTKVETRPQTPLGTCFVNALQTEHFLDPRPGNYPVFIRLQVSN